MAMTKSRSVRASAPRRAYWQALVAAHARSGVSVAAFCQRRGLRKGTLSFWRWKFAQEAKTARRGAPPAFVPIRLAPPRPAPDAAGLGEVLAAGELEITLGSTRCVRVRGRVDVEWLGHVLRAVKGLGC